MYQENVFFLNNFTSMSIGKYKKMLTPFRRVLHTIFSNTLKKLSQ